MKKTMVRTANSVITAKPTRLRTKLLIGARPFGRVAGAGETKRRAGRGRRAAPS